MAIKLNNSKVGSEMRKSYLHHLNCLFHLYHRIISPNDFMRYHWPSRDSYTIKMSHQLNSWDIIDYHWLSLIFIDYQRLSLIIIAYHGLSENAKKVNYWLTYWPTYNLKSRDASASKNFDIYRTQSTQSISCKFISSLISHNKTKIVKRSMRTVEGLFAFRLLISV